MSGLADLNMQDMTAQFPRAGWTIGSGNVRDSVTCHYSGPRVAAFGDPVAELATAKREARYHIDKDWSANAGHQGGDGYMYEIIILSDGQMIRTRKAGVKLWHCSNNYGNTHSVSIHFVFGAGQSITDAQWEAFKRLAAALMEEYKLTNRHKFYGHQEWAGASTACPGSFQARLAAWRNESLIEKPRYRVKADGTRVRAALTKYSRILREYNTGAIVDAYGRWPSRVGGGEVGGSTMWVRLVDGGYIHESLVEKVTTPYTIIVNNSTLRNVPRRSDGSAIRDLPAGLTMAVDVRVKGALVGQSDEWVHGDVRLPDGTVVEGYLHSSLVRKVG
jgi:hypothetical protein